MHVILSSFCIYLSNTLEIVQITPQRLVYAKNWFFNNSNPSFSPQIVDSMRPKFHRINEAVEEIRNKVQDVFNNGQTFTREDRQFDQYEICCESSGLIENPKFLNVSNERTISQSERV